MKKNYRNYKKWEQFQLSFALGHYLLIHYLDAQKIYEKKYMNSKN